MDMDIQHWHDIDIVYINQHVINVKTIMFSWNKNLKYYIR